MLDHAQDVQVWLEGPLDTLWHLRRTDALSIHNWMVETLDAAGEAFGLQCPTTMIVNAATAFAEPDGALSPAYCALREAERQRDEIARVLSRVAHDDDLWDALMEPLNAKCGIGFSDVAADTALLILIGEYYGKAAEAVWRIIHTWHLEKFGHGPRVTKEVFMTTVMVPKTPQAR